MRQVRDIGRGREWCQNSLCPGSPKCRFPLALAGDHTPRLLYQVVASSVLDIDLQSTVKNYERIANKSTHNSVKKSYGSHQGSYSHRTSEFPSPSSDQIQRNRQGAAYQKDP